MGRPSVNLLNVAVQHVDGLLTVRLSGYDKPLGSILLPASDDVFRKLGPAGTELILGVRPEAIAVLTEPHADAVPAEIELVEPMGSVNNIVLRFGKEVEPTVDGEPLIAVVTSNESRQRGERPGFGCDPSGWFYSTRRPNARSRSSLEIDGKRSEI